MKTKAERVTPIVVKKPTCQAPISEGSERWRKYVGHPTPAVCGRTGKFKIGGKFYCQTHAGAEALRILLEEKPT